MALNYRINYSRGSTQPLSIWKEFSNEVQRIMIHREKCPVASLRSIITIQITSWLGLHHQSRICYNTNSTYYFASFYHNEISSYKFLILNDSLSRMSVYFRTQLIFVTIIKNHKLFIIHFVWWRLTTIVNKLIHKRDIDFRFFTFANHFDDCCIQWELCSLIDDTSYPKSILHFSFICWKSLS